jgi:hypothetical protein
MYSIAFSFGTGRDPGSPRHTGHTLVFGGTPNSLRQPQNIFVSVESSTWHSRPITDSYAAMSAKPIERRRPRSAISREPAGARSIEGLGA